MFKKHWPKLVSSFAIGFAAGAGIALLLAPFNGKKMQKKVVETVEDLKIAAMKMAS